MPDLPEDREDAGVERRKIVEVIAVDALDPEAIRLRSAGITHADRHELAPALLRKQKARTGRSRAGPGHVLRVLNRLEAAMPRAYCCGGLAGGLPAGGAPAGGAAEVAGAPAAGPEELLSLVPAGPVDDSDVEAEAGGVDSAAGVGLVASCFEQAASMSAATMAVRASFVFMERFPERRATVRDLRSNKLVCLAIPIAVPNSIGSRVLLKPA